jgi:hypothetical protein
MRPAPSAAAALLPRDTRHALHHPAAAAARQGRQEPPASQVTPTSQGRQEPAPQQKEVSTRWRSPAWLPLARMRLEPGRWLQPQRPANASACHLAQGIAAAALPVAAAAAQEEGGVRVGRLWAARQGGA